MLSSVCPDLPVFESPIEMNSNVYPTLPICISIPITLPAALNACFTHVDHEMCPGPCYWNLYLHASPYDSGWYPISTLSCLSTALVMTFI